MRSKDKRLFTNRSVTDEAHSADQGVVTVALLLMMAIYLVFTFLNIAFSRKIMGVVVNSAGSLLSLSALIYYKKTGRYKTAAIVIVGMILVTLIPFFNAARNDNYALCWIAVFPPLAYYFLEIKLARIINIIFGANVLFFLISNLKNWGPTPYGVGSVANIAGATLVLVMLIRLFERGRTKAWESLNRSSMILEENKDRLQLILDSAAEAIYGLDLDGKCTFCNSSCLRMLGYGSQDELLGKNMHLLIHHHYRSGAEFPIEECSIFQSSKLGRGAHVEDEVFWRADGTSFDVEYYSYPQIRNSEVIGAVVTFLDITERKRKSDEMLYLSYHDSLTGLNNRRYFEENLKIIDIPENLPLSVIFADINGLKLTNDIFGHRAGDELIKKSAEILLKSCRECDLLTRFGGDEFVVLLPRTDSKQAGQVCESIRSGLYGEKVAAIQCSISLGAHTKLSSSQSIDVIMADAENSMFKDKIHNRKSNEKVILDNIVQTLFTRIPRELQHARAVSELCAAMGTLLGLSAGMIQRLEQAGFLHDIGKVVLDDCMINKDFLAKDEKEEMQQHSVYGYRILNLFDETVDIAELVYNHHEKWDGQGYPRGLKGTEIPFASRVISIAETYERIRNRESAAAPCGKEKAVQAIREGSGKRFDPELAVPFADMVESRSDL